MVWLGHPQKLAPAGQGQDTERLPEQRPWLVFVTGSSYGWQSGLGATRERLQLQARPRSSGQGRSGKRLDGGLAAEELYGERAEEGRDAVLLQQVQLNELRHRA